MADAGFEQKSVHELQRIAIEAGHADAPRKKHSLSRSARLLLIDMLSRWSASGLALIAGVSIYLAITAGRIYPGRAAAWTLLVLMSIWTCRTLRKKFRSGEKISARPFRWRASYTSCLSVLGVAFGSAAVLLLPETAPPGLLLQTIALASIASIGAGALHSAHPMSALGISAPAAILGLAALFRNSVQSPIITAYIASIILGAGCIILLTRANYRQVAQKRPRTTILRRELPEAHEAQTPFQRPETSSANAV